MRRIHARPAQAARGFVGGGLMATAIIIYTSKEVVDKKTILGGGFDLETGILESHFCEANYLLRDKIIKRQVSSIIYSFGKVRDKNLSISCLDPKPARSACQIT